MYKRQAYDSLILGLDTLEPVIQEDLRTVATFVEDIDRIIGTILRGSGGAWGESQKELLLRLSKRRGWPVNEEIVRSRLTRVATDIAEIKGAKIGEFGKVNGNSFLREQVSSDVSRNRISEKLSFVDSILQNSKN